MNQDQLKAIQEAIDIIENNLKSPLDLDGISKEVGISKYHLHRLFHSITDKPIMAYARRRRLSESLKDLLGTNLKIIDISSEYQFSHEQSYIRAFKQEFGITPMQYRKAKQEMSIEPRIDTKHLNSIGQGLLLAPRMCMKPHFCVQGIRQEIVHELNLRENLTNQLVKTFKEEYLPLIGGTADQTVYYGIVLYTKDRCVSVFYMPSVEIAEPVQPEPPFLVREFPTQEYAVFRYIGLHSPYEITFATLYDLYEYINRWKTDTVYSQAAPYHFERVDLKACSDTYCEMDIYVPIEIRAQG